MTKQKATPKKICKIVCPDVKPETYTKIKKLAEEEKRTIGKQTEYLAELAISRLYTTK